MTTRTFALLHLSLATKNNATKIVVSPWLGDESEGKLLIMLTRGGYPNFPIDSAVTTEYAVCGVSGETENSNHTGGLMHELQRDNTATFSFLEGDVDSAAGPGIAGYHDGPYYSYYRFPRTFSHEDSDESDILEAYEQLSETVALEGPFDGVLGFSHGGTLAAGFMIHHAKMNPNEPAPFRCAIFINSLPPFRMEPGKRPVVDEGLEGFISIPCVHIAGAKDPLFEYSLALYRLCAVRESTFAVHGKGHEVPCDQKNVAIIASAIRKLSSQIL